MTRESEHDVPRTTGLVLLVLFLGLVGVGIATVLLPEIRSESMAPGPDAGLAEEP